MASVTERIRTVLPPEEGPKRTCGKCGSVGVCLIVRTLKGLEQQFVDAEDKNSKAPFKHQDFAQICSEFQSVYVNPLDRNRQLGEELSSVRRTASMTDY